MHNAHFSFSARKRTFALLLLAILFLAGCRKDEPIPDVSNVKINLQVIRFDSLLYNTDSADIPELYRLMRNKHHDFLKSYIRVMTAPGTKVTDTVDFLRAMKHPALKRLYDTTTTILGDFSKYRREFDKALKYYKYYFPHRPVPNLYTYVSEFAMGAYTYGDSVLASGLDFYLGEGFPYDPMMFPVYIQRTMTPEHLVPTTMHALANDLAGDIPGDTFLDYIISNGKVLYLLDHFLPETPDSIFLGYTAAQTQWVEDNELNMWSHFVHEKLLYSTKMRDFRKLINPSPNSSGMPPEAPGRTGNWVGWQIIKAYMKRHPKTTLEQLMQIKDSKRILQESRYKPKPKK